jgi:hypothetical protein
VKQKTEYIDSGSDKAYYSRQKAKVVELFEGAATAVPGVAGPAAGTAGAGKAAKGSDAKQSAAAASDSKRADSGSGSAGAAVAAGAAAGVAVAAGVRGDDSPTGDSKGDSKRGGGSADGDESKGESKGAEDRGEGDEGDDEDEEDGKETVECLHYLRRGFAHSLNLTSAYRDYRDEGEPKWTNFTEKFQVIPCVRLPIGVRWSACVLAWMRCPHDRCPACLLVAAALLPSLHPKLLLAPC